MDNSFYRRRGDAVIILEQNNIQQTLFINDLNNTAEKLLLYVKEELVRKPLSVVLSPDTRNLIEDNLVFEEHNPQENLINVVGRIIRFEMLDKEKNIRPVKVKLFPLLGKDTRILEFEMLFRDLNIFEKMSNERLATPNYKRELIPELQVLNKESFLSELNILLNIANTGIVEGVIGKVTLPEVNNVLPVVNALKNNVRATDIIGCLAPNKIIFILLECPSPQATRVIQRIWVNISAIGGKGAEIHWLNLEEKASKTDILERLNLK